MSMKNNMSLGNCLFTFHVMSRIIILNSSCQVKISCMNIQLFALEVVKNVCPYLNLIKNK